MIATTRPSLHRAAAGEGVWQSVVRTGPADAGRHRREAVRAADDGSAALLSRAGLALVLWLLAFGLFAMAEGWPAWSGSAIALAVLLGVVIAASHAATSAPDQADDERLTHERGVNPRRIGYGSRT